MALTSFFTKSGSYTNEQMGDLFKAILVGDNASEGVIKHPVSGPDNLLEVTSSGAKTVAVATGWAVVDRRVIYNDAEALVTLPDGACTGTVVLRYVNGSPDVASFEYVPTGTSLIQTPGVQFEIPLATYTVIAGTNTVDPIVDARVFVGGFLRPLSFINDTANADMTIGLTINQGANDDEALALKSSDVAHTITATAESDTYASFGKYSAEGGANIRGINATNKPGMELNAYSVGDIAVGKTSAAVGNIILRGTKSDGGTGNTSLGAEANIAVARNYNTTVWIVDAEGDTWQSGEALIDDTAMVPGFLGRQGGSATNWSTFGNTDYTSGQRVRFQCGVKSCGPGTTTTVTFPVAFSYPPVVQYSMLSDNQELTMTAVAATYVSFNNSALVSTYLVHWLAIGPA